MPAPREQQPAADEAASAPPGAMVARVFAALGDPTRLRLVGLLCAGSALSIAQLTASTDVTRQGVTKHLQVLAQAGIVRDVKSGRERLWQLEPAQIAEARRALEAIGREWDMALAKLKAFAEADAG